MIYHPPASPEEAFALLGNETRIAIVDALGDADGSLSFSDLRSAVGVRDSGLFNYHLSKLLGAFVERTDDGYELSEAGVHAYESILDGSFGDRRRTETSETDGDRSRWT